MKKNVKNLVFLLFLTFIFTSCIPNITIDLANLPTALKDNTFYINSSGGNGTVHFSATKITVTRGSMPDASIDLVMYNDSAEYDTDTLKANGYSITSSFTEGDSTDPFDLGTFDLICTKSNSPTLTYSFGICPSDIAVDKKENGISDNTYTSILGYSDLDTFE